MNQNLLVILGGSFIIKSVCEKYFKESIKQFWLNLNNNDSDKLIDFLLTLLISCLLGILSLSYFIISSPKKNATQPVQNIDESEILYQIMKKRRSIMPKDYDQELIEDKTIQNILECANFAPTHGKTEPWRFIVYRRKNFSELFQYVIQWYEKNADHLYKNQEEKNEQLQQIQDKFDNLSRASHLICIGMKRQAIPNKIMPEWEEIAAVATSVQNIYLQSCAKKLGGYWSSMTFAKEARDSIEMLQYLGLDDKEDRFFGAFAIAKTSKYEQYLRTPGDYNNKIQFR